MFRAGVLGLTLAATACAHSTFVAVSEPLSASDYCAMIEAAMTFAPCSEDGKACTVAIASNDCISWMTEQTTYFMVRPFAVGSDGTAKLLLSPGTGKDGGAMSRD